MWIWFLTAGIVSGIVAGMGMGGGTLLIPILTIFFGVVQSKAQGINLFAFLPCALVSLMVHIKNKLVNFKVGVPIILTGIVASVGASLLAVNTKNEILKILFGVFLLLVGLQQGGAVLFEIIKKKRNKKIKYIPQIVYKTKRK